ncbi:hypothetical protein BDN71DRAFT_547316 [Pleurotus eryngii]|uniref:Uncharacterized protein n=1 Tax=Pleurotus eryngii TaxID=5323 RepID=A0A9P5ZHR6_PLEER|nr:hypothetical protein BDN71DRAFT_547316 [Pleurotus eryngii]
MQGSASRLSSPHSDNVQSYNQHHDSSLATFLAAHAPLYPIEVYALAASIDLHSLGQSAFLYPHERDLCPTDDEDCVAGKLRLTQEMVRKMGALTRRTAVCTAPEDRPAVQKIRPR